MDNSNLFLTSEDVDTILRVSKRTLQILSIYFRYDYLGINLPLR